MRYFLGLREEDGFFTEADAQAMYARFEARQNQIPDLPSFIFEWDEKQDMEDMTGLTDIKLTS